MRACFSTGLSTATVENLLLRIDVFPRDAAAKLCTFVLDVAIGIRSVAFFGRAGKQASDPFAESC